MNRLLINLFAIVLLILGLFYAMNHYSDGGCEGGLCGLYFIFHGIPYLLTSVFFLIAMNLCFARKKSFIILMVISVLINLFILFSDYGNDTKPQIPSFFILAGQVILTIVYYSQKGSVIYKDNDGADNQDK